MDTCKICGNTERNQHFTAREMMFGLREKFPYLECGKCGCVQLEQVPHDLGRFYPPNYYSLQQGSPLKVFLRHQWASYAFSGLNPIGWLISKVFHDYSEIVPLRNARVRKDVRVLDVGGGTGQLILDLHHLGFKQLTCADPFIEKDIVYGHGVQALKRTIAELDGQYDLVMLHHSFEHMDHPLKVMHELSRLLAPTGLLLIRIPVASSYAWRHYRTNWVNLDAPRHLFLHTPATVSMLAKEAGLKVDRVEYEGDESQFWASEQYAKDIPLLDPRSHGNRRFRSAFSRNQIQEFKARAAELNREGLGDAACFFLSKASQTKNPNP